MTSVILLLNCPALQTLLPSPVPVHHLGLFRQKGMDGLVAVEYYNNLPYHRPSAGAPGPSQLTILTDPVIATGATACAAIDTLRDWGVQRVIMIAVIASEPGLRRAAAQWAEGTEIWVAGLDAECDEDGMIKPGLGDVGDRLFLTIGNIGQPQFGGKTLEISHGTPPHGLTLSICRRFDHASNTPRSKETAALCGDDQRGRSGNEG
ncbi:hypothetical protein MRB53_041775 [Persea americana]|nr:hypothetical protein MRB53_041775 [Persea americana]